jgi:hypothetical protein
MNKLSVFFILGILSCNTVFAIDCDKIALERIPALSSCLKLTSPAEKTTCGLKIIEAPLHACIKIADQKARNDCVVKETKTLKEGWPAECVALHQAEVGTRFEESEKAKHGKSSYENNDEKQRIFKEIQIKNEKNKGKTIP